jgi:hypothetical protein
MNAERTDLRCEVSPSSLTDALKAHASFEEDHTFQTLPSLVSAAMANALGSRFGTWMTLRHGNEEILSVYTKRVMRAWHGEVIDCFCIGNINVSVMQQRKGYYARFLAEVEKRARNAGFRLVAIESVQRESQHALYLRRHYRKQNEDFIKAVTTEDLAYSIKVENAIATIVDSIDHGFSREEIVDKGPTWLSTVANEDLRLFVKKVEYAYAYHATQGDIYDIISRTGPRLTETKVLD